MIDMEDVLRRSDELAGRLDGDLDPDSMREVLSEWEAVLDGWHGDIKIRGDEVPALELARFEACLWRFAYCQQRIVACRAEGLCQDLLVQRDDLSIKMSVYEDVLMGRFPRMYA